MQNNPTASRQRDRAYDGVFALVAINIVLFLLDRVLNLNFLYLNHARPQWYQFVTSLFLHANWAHISGNLFFLYIFGKLIEEEEGLVGVVLSYLVCGIGANVASVLLQPGNIVSLGASGAVFGLFAVSVLVRLSWHWRKILEVLILGQFVLERFFSELQRIGVNDGINRIAHVGGALVGVALIFGLQYWNRTQDRRSGS